jgi:hypothetical protein
MTNIKIGGREIPLLFEMPQYAELEEAVGILSDTPALFLKGKFRIKNVAAAIRVMGNGGLEAAGERPDLTDEWVLKNMRPAWLRTYQIAILAAITAGMHMETQEEKERDLVLEELERKKEPGS